MVLSVANNVIKCHGYVYIISFITISYILFIVYIAFNRLLKLLRNDYNEGRAFNSSSSVPLLTKDRFAKRELSSICTHYKDREILEKERLASQKFI